MKRRLACVDIPHIALQVLLLDKPEWKNEAVVLLDRDEANGRIIDLNETAINLGLGRGMSYGPCLGIYRHLKGGVVQDEKLESWYELIQKTLLDFSPHIEHSWFQKGTYWLNAKGLSNIFTSVKPWLSLIEEAINGLGFDCGLALGSGRFSTFAAARLKPVGSFNIFPDEGSEKLWLSHVPVEIININDDVMKLIKRLKLLTIGDLLQVPAKDIKHRLSSDAARMMDFIRNEDSIPLQYSEPPESSSWSVRPDEPMFLVPDLHSKGMVLVDHCLRRARLTGLRVQSLSFDFIGSSFALESGIRPSSPTSNRELLSRLLLSRIEYLDFENPVHEIRCQALFTETQAPQIGLFDSEHHGEQAEALKVLTSLQAERGLLCVQYAEIVDNPMPARQYRLKPWSGFPETENEISDSREKRLVRRIALSPAAMPSVPGRMSRVVYSGGWWDRPYHHEMAYTRIHNRWNWLQNDGDDSWILVGWVD